MPDVTELGCSTSELAHHGARGSQGTTNRVAEFGSYFTRPTRA